jgi:N-acyl homoserine lactone hydrolase
VDISRLHLGDVRLPPTHPVAPNLLVALYAYIVRHLSRTLLFDTGLGPHHDVLDSYYELRRMALPTLDPDVVVNCHLHFDHCGGNQFVPNATILVQRVELESARQPMYTAREWVDFPGARLQVIDGEYTVCDGVRIVPTPGHTAGHQSLVLTTPDGVAVLAGQVTQTAAEFETSGDPSVVLLKSLSPRRALFAHDAAEWKA